MINTSLKFSSIDYKRTLNSTRAFVAFKPDSLAKGNVVGKGLKLLSDRMRANDLKFRITAPVLSSIDKQFSDNHYKEHLKSDIYPRLNAFIMGKLENINVGNAPVLFFMVEIKNSSVNGDPVSFLRNIGIIGPTNPFKAISKEETSKNDISEIMKSVRYNLMKNYNTKDEPSFCNKIHCSANREEALDELGNAYMNIPESYLNQFYDTISIEYLKSTWNKPKKRHRSKFLPIFSLYLLRDKNINKYYNSLKTIETTFNWYRDFKSDQIKQLLNGIYDVVPQLLEDEADFLTT